jgi:broad specificity phosphatase PhoE
LEGALRELDIFLIRHGQRYRDKDEITLQARRKARAVGKDLRRQYPDYTFIGICSQWKRARQTLEALFEG